jgi:serine/threonine-protein kinase RsbW
MESLSHTLDSTRQSIDAAEIAVIDLARRAGLTRTTSARIGLAVREIFTNAVVHGNRYSASKKVFFEVRRASSQMTIVVSDEGNGFDPDRVSDPLSPEGLWRPSGRGLLLARKLVDELHIRPADRGGTRITLVKYIRSSAMQQSNVA